MPPRLKPRPYQREALEWALAQGSAVICMPTGTGKTLIAALWAEELLRRGAARRILFLEPTRFLVEQVALFLRETMGLPAAPLHGSLPRPERERAWRSRIVVATPEIVVAEWERFEREGFDALVVDECHHTTGQDPYRRVVEGWSFRYRLGLSALIPASRRRLIEETIGPIRCWGWDHPWIRPYMPPWAAEVYEAPLNRAERRLYDELERHWAQASGRERALLGAALRWLSRDGAAALRESYGRSARLRRLLEPLQGLLFDPGVRPAHKLPVLYRVLSDHEGFQKAIVFVDRVLIARLIGESLESMGVALVLGRRHRPAEALEKARSPETRLVVATSAGEEGIDLPEADLLVLWSNTSSPLRFVQRLGRLLRPSPGGGQKYAVFLATPETVDVDSLLDGLVQAERAGVYVSVSPETVRRLISVSRRRRILEALEHQPLPPDIIARYLGADPRIVEAGLRWLAGRGYIGYIYTPIGRIYWLQDRVEMLRERYKPYLTPSPGIVASLRAHCATGTQTAKNRSYRDALAWALRVLERCGEIQALEATAQVPLGPGLVAQARRSYRFLMRDPRVLQVAVDNVYSAESYARP